MITIREQVATLTERLTALEIKYTSLKRATSLGNIREKELLTSSEAAYFIGRSIATLNRLAKAGKISVSDPNDKLRYYKKSELQEWMLSKRIHRFNERSQAI